MANKAISMSKLRQILRLKDQNISNRQAGKMLGIHRETVRSYANQVKAQSLSYKELLEMEDSVLNAMFHKPIHAKLNKARLAELENYFPTVEKELGRVGVDKMNLWLDYKDKHGNGYAYSHFCRGFNKWNLQQQVSAHFEHKAGEKIFVDYTGSKLHIVDRKTGEIKPVEVLVVLLGFSQYTYVEASLSQKKEDFIGGIENALHYFEGVPSAIVTDNLKSAVTKSCKYEPKVNETFESFALHYETVVLPTRAYKPKDKALVEGAVKIIYKRIFAPLRDRIFFNLKELNDAIKEQLEVHNTKLFQGKPHSRKQLFIDVEKQTLHPLASTRYELQNTNWLTVHKNSHIYLGEDKHYYSVPYKYISQKVKVVYTRSSIEIYYHHERIAAHKRAVGLNRYTTQSAHVPSTHNFVSEWNPEKFISWAAGIGEPTRIIIEKILETKEHPEQAYKSCLGVLSFAKSVGKERLNNACDRAMYYQSYGYNIIKNILKKGLDKEPIQLEIPCEIPNHGNIRGEVYYN